MKRLMTMALLALSAVAVCAGEPVAGGMTFKSAVNVDGTDYPANTTIYAESYPTQFVVKPVVPAQNRLFFATFDASHGGDKIYPDYTGTTFVFMPPPTVGDVVEVTFSSYANYVWADANTDVPDAEQDGTEEKPYRVLQKAVDAMRDKNKNYNLVLVKRGDYNEGGTPKSGIALASRVTVPAKTCFIIRAVEGPSVTTIFGEKDTTSGEPAPYTGWGENGRRCAALTGGAALQGFTLRDGSGARNTASVTNYKNGGAVIGPDNHNATVLDCVISNACGNVAAVANARVIRCRFIDNHHRTCLLSQAPAVSCTFFKNELVDPNDSYSYFSQSALTNCTFAGNVKIHSALPGTAVNSVFRGVKNVAGTEGGSGNWVWDIGSGTPSASYTLQDPKIANAADGDLRLGMASPCIGAVDTLPSDYWKTATSDVDGNRLHVTPDGKMTPGALQSEFPEAYTGELYVDPVNGRDTNDGWKRSRPLKTIQAAMSSPNLASGDTIYLEPGRYDQSNTPAVDSGDGRGLSRVSVPAGVTLASLGSAEDTVIVGAASETVGETSGAVRCVILHTRSAIRGFTLTGGYTDNTSANGANGAGVVDSAGNGMSYAYDCVISNNVSVGRGGGANAVTCIRCRLSDNSAAEAIGAGIHGGTLINCIVGPQNANGNCSRTFGTKIRNCTFLPARRASEEQEAVNYSTSVSADDCRNSLFLCLTRAEARYTNCIIATNAVDIIRKGRTYNPAVLGGTVTLIRQEDAFVKKSGVTQARSPAVDAGDNALYDMSWGDVDIRGARRIVNGTIDIGACEFDPSLLKGLMFIFQ